MTPEMEKRLAEVRENLARLDGCERHLFTPPKVTQPFIKLTCRRCGGKLDPADIGLYIRGYQAAGGDPNDILPGWER